MKTLYTILYCLLPAVIFAQQAQNFSFEKIGTVNPTELEIDRNLTIQHLEMPFPGSDPYKIYLHELKQRILDRQEAIEPGSSFKTSAIGDTVVVGMNFQGNQFDGVPNDNDIAINTNGQLISVTNSMIYVFDVDRDSLLLSISLEAFTDSSVGLPARKFDPRITYDHQEDKFIIAYLSGSLSTENGIVVGFSETSDPLGNWNLYGLPGNPFNDTTWSDYPMMEIADGRLMITVNQIRDNVSWQLGFSQSIIWQIDKASGYAGGNLDTRLYSGINFNGKPLRNLTPVENDRAASSGNGWYFISNRNFDSINDTFWVVEVQSDINDPNPMVDVSFSIANRKYGVPPNAHQPNNFFLQTNDARVLDAIMENGEIHFVGNTINHDNQRAAIFHGILWDAPNNGTRLNIISDTALEFGYPAIAYSGRFDGDQQFIIGFNHSSENVDPGMSAIHWDQFTGLSPRSLVKNGDSYINTQSGNIMRWGDYSGAQALSDEPGVVWLGGYHGRFDPPPGSIIYRNNSTWIAKVESPGSPSVGVDATDVTARRAMAYPNPSSGRFYLDFEVSQTDKYRVELYAMSGELVEILFADKVKAGKNRISFQTEGLANGQYILLISNSKNIREEIQIQLGN